MVFLTETDAHWAGIWHELHYPTERTQVVRYFPWVANITSCWQVAIMGGPGFMHFRGFL